MAPPKKYKPEFVEQARKICELGATDHELARFFGVTKQSISNWRHEYPDFAAAMVVGKELADQRVERALYQRAVGYTYESERIFCDKGRIVRATTLQHEPPDTKAAIHWLSVRRRDQWKGDADSPALTQANINIILSLGQGLMQNLNDLEKRYRECEAEDAPAQLPVGSVAVSGNGRHHPEDPVAQPATPPAGVRRNGRKRRGA